MNNDIILVSGDKGGNGKSTVAAAVAEAIAPASHRAMLAIDADARNPSLQNRLEHAEQFQIEWRPIGDLGQFRDVAMLLQGDDRPAIIDLPAGAGKIFKNDGKVIAKVLKHLKRRIHILWVINLDADPIRSLIDQLPAFTEFAVSLTIVMNGYHGDVSAFSQYLQSGLAKVIAGRDPGSDTWDLLQTAIAEGRMKVGQAVFPKLETTTAGDLYRSGNGARKVIADHSLGMVPSLIVESWFEEVQEMVASMRSRGLL